jgi:hypothetical protein
MTTTGHWLIGVALAMTGCPWGQKYPYHLAQPFVEQGRAMSIALAVVDQRTSVNAAGVPISSVSRGMATARRTT